MFRQYFKEKYLNFLGYKDEFEVDQCYQYGRHVERNFEIALKYYRVAFSKKRNPEIFLHLSALYADKAVNQNGKSYYCLGQMHEMYENWQEAKNAYKAAAAEHYQIGRSYYNQARMYEMRQKWHKAKMTYEKAADNGYPDALYRIGCFYKEIRFSPEKEVCFPKNKTLEFIWYRKAAAKLSKHGLNVLISEANQDADAAYILGEMYELGEIKHNDGLIKAFQYYLFAAKQKDDRALEKLEKYSVHWDDQLHLEMLYVYLNIFSNDDLVCFHIIQLMKKNLLDTKSLESLAKNNPHFSFAIAKLYEVEKNIQAALKFYLMGFENGCEKSLQEIKNHNSHLTYDMRFQISHKYQCLGNKMLAMNELKILTYSIVAKTKIQALIDSDYDYALVLAKLYAKDGDMGSFFKYAFMAAKKSSVDAISEIETKNQYFDDHVKLQLGLIYKDIFKNLKRALFYFKKLADAGNLDGVIQLKKLMKKKPECACDLAGMYESEGEIEKAFHYYIVGALANHAESYQQIESFAKSGNSLAQYMFGVEYFHAQNNRMQAIHWCTLAAEKENEKAMTYLKTTIFPKEVYMHIADKYEHGKGVKQNMLLAIYFYEKGSNNDHKNSAFRLAEIYHANCEESPDILRKAFHQYIKAYQLGHDDALIMAETLVDRIEPVLLFELAKSFLEKNNFLDRDQAVRWLRMAKDGGCLEAGQYLTKFGPK